MHLSEETDTSECSDNVQTVSKLPSLQKLKRMKIETSVHISVPANDSDSSDISICNSTSADLNHSADSVATSDAENDYFENDNATIDSLSNDHTGTNSLAIDNDRSESEVESDVSIDNFDPDTQDYNTILTKLKRDWLFTELDHKVSKSCSDAFWKLALKMIPPLYESKKCQKISRKVAQFAHIRKQLYDELAPRVDLQIAYKNNSTGEITVTNDTITQVKNFPPNEFTKQYEIASVDAKEMVKVQKKKCPQKTNQILLSVDGVNECNSNSNSIDVFSAKFKNCRVIYPSRIVRPLGRVKVNNGAQLKKVLDNMKCANCCLHKLVADNPKRSCLKCALAHNSYYPCEYCVAKGFRKNTSKTESLIKSQEKLKNEQRKAIQNKITAISNSDSETRDLEVALLQSVLEDLEQNYVSKKSQIVWPSSTRNAPKRNTEEIRSIADKLEAGETLSRDESKGIVGKSVLLSQPNFDYTKDSPAEYMHSGCLGLIKRMVELTFQVGQNRERNTKRKLSPVQLFNEKIKGVKYPRECSRRARDLDFAVLKAQEYRNMALFLFPIILECIEEDAKERKLWLLLSFMFRACTVPNEEHAKIPENLIHSCMDTFYILYEKLFGLINCTYSVHVVSSHLPEIRGEDPLTETSAFCFESFYGEMRNSFTPGTVSSTKQIIQKTFLKRILGKHSCNSPITITAHDTALECNSLVYTYENGAYNFYKVIGIDQNNLTCYKQGKFPCQTNEAPNLRWDLVGVFERGGVLEDKVNLSLNEVKGKVMVVNNYLITAPNNVLREK